MISNKEQEVNSKQKDKKVIKCVIWDLDNTLGHGILLEDEKVSLQENMARLNNKLFASLRLCVRHIHPFNQQRLNSKITIAKSRIETANSILNQ